MKLTRQRKIYLAILAIGLAALAVDRVFLGSDGAGPSRANAQTSGPAGSGPELAVLPPGSRAAASALAADALAERLRRLSKKQGIEMKAVKDAFACPEGWLPGQAASQPARPPNAGALEFQAQHQLMAVMAGSRGSAIVDGKCLLIGQKLGLYQLVSVGKRSAVFRCGDEQIVLKLKE